MLFPWLPFILHIWPMVSRLWSFYRIRSILPFSGVLTCLTPSLQLTQQVLPLFPQQLHGPVSVSSAPSGSAVRFPTGGLLFFTTYQSLFGISRMMYMACYIWDDIKICAGGTCECPFAWLICMQCALICLLAHGTRYQVSGIRSYQRGHTREVIPERSQPAWSHWPRKGWPASPGP